MTPSKITTQTKVVRVWPTILLATLLLPLSPLFAAPTKPTIALHPVGATYSRAATARFYVNAYSVNNGYLEYQWYRSQLFDKPIPMPAGGYTDAQKATIKANATRLPEGVAATLVTTTPGNFTGTKYCYYWVKITNSKNGEVDFTESELALAKLVGKNLPNHIINGNMEYWRSSPIAVPRTMNGYKAAGGTDPFGNTFQFQDWLYEAKRLRPTGPGGSYYPNEAGATRASDAHYDKNNGWYTTHKFMDYTVLGAAKGKVYSYGVCEVALPIFYGLDNVGNGRYAAELGAEEASNLYQNIATVPGKIYEWKLDHAARSSLSSLSPFQKIAVVIGSAINEEGDYGAGVPKRWNRHGAAPYPPNPVVLISGAEQPYPYGVNINSYFNDIVNKVVAEKRTTMQNIPDGGYSTSYNGSQYYVYIGSDASKDSKWVKHSGVYSIPAGQGITVFGFVYVYPMNESNGNILDNITFASGAPFSPSPEITYHNEAMLISDKTKSGYVYGIAAVRGSSVSLVPDAVAYYDPDGNGPQAEIPLVPAKNLGIGGWYATYGANIPFANGGVIRFKRLTPGKTYRIIGIPRLAVSSALRVNESPVHVLDEGYYKDVKMHPAYIGNDSTVWNLSVTVYTAADGVTRKARISVQNARPDVEYALLPDVIDASGRHRAVTSGPAHPNTRWKAQSDGKQVTFDGLMLDTYYHLVARPYGYEEVTYASAAYNVDGVTPVYITVKTPGVGVSDIDSSNVSRNSCQSITIANTKGGYTYAIFDPETGKLVGRPQAGTGRTLTFSVPSASKAYQAISKSGDVNWMEGVRAYGCSNDFWVDYRDEAVKSSGNAAGHIPVGVEYRISVGNAAGTPLTAGWVAGTGSQPVSLSARMLANNAVSVLDSLTSLGVYATLYYRVKAGLEGYIGRWVSPMKSVAIPCRGAPPRAYADYAPDYVKEEIRVNFGSLEFAQEFAQEGAKEWASVAQGASWTFLAADWGEGTSKRAFRVRHPSTSTSFSSAVNVDTIPARPPAPGNLILANNGSDVRDVSKVAICRLTPGVVYQYKTTSNPSWISFTPTVDGKSDSINFTSNSICYVRLAATSTAPASLPASLAVNMLNIQPVYFPDLTYGVSPMTQNVIIKNHDAKKDFTIVSLTLEGSNSGSYSLSNSYRDLVIKADNTNANWELRPLSNLNAGVYNTTLKLVYSYQGVQYNVSTNVYLTVRKTSWDMNAIEGEFDVSQTKSDRLVLRVAGAPAGATLTYYFNKNPAPGNAQSIVGNDGKATFTFTAANGLKPKTIYVVSARAEGDNNHYYSPLVMLATGYTACATPLFNAVATVNYLYERLDPVGEYFGNRYTLGCASCGGLPIRSPSTPYSLAPILDNTANKKIVFFVVSNAEGSYPASDTGYSAPILGRSAAPTITATAVKHASGPASDNGSISVAGTFEYRYHGSTSEGWTPATQSAIKLGVGDYDVRYPAVAGKSFATHMAMATVSTILKQPASITIARENISPHNATLSITLPPTANPVTYQWYANTAPSASGGVAVANATGREFTVPQTLAVGVYYYYCIATFGGVSTLTSSAATVTVTNAKKLDITNALLAPKIYDGTTIATVTDVTFSGLAPGETFRLGEDYIVDSARFASADVGGSDMVMLYVSINLKSLKASAYALTNGKGYVLRGQRIQKVVPDTSFLDYRRNSVVGYDGNPHVFPIALKSKYRGMDNIRVKYNGSATPPVNLGAYAITADIANNANFSDKLGLSLSARLTIVSDTLSVVFARILPKTYNGTNIATVDSIAFGGFSKHYTLVRDVDYTVDSAVFDKASAGGGRTVSVYVSLKPGSAKANSYLLRSRVYVVPNQTIAPSPQAILFLLPSADTTVYVNHGGIMLAAVSIPGGGAPPLPVRFRLAPGNTSDATVIGNILIPIQPGTVHVKAYVERNDNYKNVDTVRRTIIITDLDSCTVTFSDGNNKNVVKVAKGAVVSRPYPDPTGKLVFDGWYADAACKVAWDFARSRVRRDTTLYAGWISHDNIVINGDTQVVRGDTISYFMQCGEKEVWFSAPGILHDTLRIADATFTRDTIITLGAPGGSNPSYRIKLVKAFEFGGIMYAQLGGRLLMVVKNPANNGGFNFQEARWWRKSGSIRFPVGSNKFYYANPAGEVITDTIYVELREAHSSEWRSTCPYIPSSVPASRPRMVIYPNPVAGGAVIHLKEDIMDENNVEERYTTFSLINVQGSEIHSGKVSELKQGFTMPDVQGLYFFVFEGKAGKKIIRVSVGKRAH